MFRSGPPRRPSDKDQLGQAPVGLAVLLHLAIGIIAASRITGSRPDGAANAGLRLDAVARQVALTDSAAISAIDVCPNALYNFVSVHERRQR